jgi:uncharacterized protein
MSEEIRDPKPFTPIEPVQLGGGDTFQFRCRKGIPCFNQCCQNIDIMLTPYDVLRLKRRFDLSSREWIDRDTRDFQMDGHAMPGLKLRTKAGSNECIYLTPEGCSVYEDRPAACRYYALGQLTMRQKGSAQEEDSYFLVKEEHCLGHFEAQTQTVDEYRRGQGVDVYDDANREWRRILLKKRSAGPAIGKPSPKSMELFFLASYDVDGFRAFVASTGFQELFEIEPDLLAKIMTDDEALLAFAMRFLKQVLFGEITIPLKQEAAKRRHEEYRRRSETIEREAAERRARDQDAMYDSLDD